MQKESLHPFGPLQHSKKKHAHLSLYLALSDDKRAGCKESDLTVAKILGWQPASFLSSPVYPSFSRFWAYFSNQAELEANIQDLQVKLDDLEALVTQNAQLIADKTADNAQLIATNAQLMLQLQGGAAGPPGPQGPPGTCPPCQPPPVGATCPPCPRDLQDLQEQMVPRVQLVQMVLQDLGDSQEQLVLQVVQVHQGFKVDILTVMSKVKSVQDKEPKKKFVFIALPFEAVSKP